jgi:hypothetical protein
MYRLPFVRRMLALWDGPASIAVYIPIPRNHATAAKCRSDVLEHISTTASHLKALRNGTADASGTLTAPPLMVSLLYANHVSPNIGCNISEHSTGLEVASLDRNLWENQFSMAPYIDVYDAEYPVAALRQLALDAVCSLSISPHVYPTSPLCTHHALFSGLCLVHQ